MRVCRDLCTPDADHLSRSARRVQASRERHSNSNIVKTYHLSRKTAHTLSPGRYRMLTVAKLNFLLLLLCVIATGVLPGGTPRPVPAQTVESSTESPNLKKQEPQVSNAEPTEDGLEEVPEGELAPAAIQLDLSKASPLIQELYAATRETKEEPILARLAQAKKLVENGA